MKSAILAVVIAAGVGEFVSWSNAQDIKKLQLHPAAAADQSLRQGDVGLPSGTASHPGAAGTNYAKPATGDAVASGGTSTAQSRHKDIKKLQPHPAAAADQSLRQGDVGLLGTASQPGAAGTDYVKPATGAAVASGGTSTAQSRHKDIKKLQPHPAAAADQSLRQGDVGLPGTASQPGAAGTDYVKPATGDAVASGGTSTAQSNPR
jgi:pilus assembly protein FimV